MREPLSENLVKKIPRLVFDILEKFTSAGYEIYLVGGSVRDLLLGKQVHDCDFTTNAHPEVIQTFIPDSFYDNVFGTVGTLVKTKPSSAPPNRRASAGEEKYEITTYRGEQGYSDFRRPDKVWWGEKLEEDLKRRDFTINSMAIGSSTHNPPPQPRPTSPATCPPVPGVGRRGELAGGRADSQLTTHPHPTFELIDLFGGQEDLKNKLIRAVGKADERFGEDALRMIRAVRFSSQLGFTIEPDTFTAMQNNASLLNQISKERIKDELFKILASDFPSEGITLLLTSGLLQYIIPELIKGYGLSQTRHHIYDVWTHSIMSLKHCPSKDPLVRLATLLHDVGKPVVAQGEGEKRTFYNHEVIGASIARNIARRLKFSKKEDEKLITLVRWHQFTVDERQTDSAIRRFIKNVGRENIADILDLRIGDRLGGGAKETSWRLEKFKKRIEEVQIQPFSVTDLKINGRDVMEILGIPPGPKVGEILNLIFEEVVEKMIENERETLLKRLEEIKADYLSN